MQKKQYLCSGFMLPVDFIESMHQQLGSEAELLIRALETEPVTSIRLNSKLDVLTFEGDTEEVPWHIDGYYLSVRPQFTLDPLFHAGCYYVQEASSMFLQQVLEQYLDTSSLVLDLCAAPGGKSTLISEYLGRDGLLVSNEVVRQRVFILSENIQKWGNGNTVVTHNTAEEFGERCKHLFDCVVVDAPCSGEGMFRKDPQAREEWSPKAVMLCAERQRSILMDVWDALKPGGVLVYSTCTFNEEENEKNGLNVHRILIEPGRSIVAEAGYTIYTAGGIKTTPNRHYVFVDGGMSDNIRPALYQAEYDAFVDGKENEPANTEYTVAGKCCESGDILIQKISLPDMQRGDLIVLKTTGAYGYSMASHYNKLPLPAVVFVKDGTDRLVIRRETFEHMTALEV